MDLITKDQLQSFMEYYHHFHDSYITQIHYDINRSEIEVLIDVCWSGTPILREDKTYETNKTKMKMVFYGVKQCNNREIFSWEYIYAAFMKYIKIEDKEYICFASDEEDPFIYIVCDHIAYEELKDV